MNIRYLSRFQASFVIDDEFLSRHSREAAESEMLDQLSRRIAHALFRDLKTVDKTPYGERTSVVIDVLTTSPIPAAHSSPVNVSKA